MRSGAAVGIGLSFVLATIAAQAMARQVKTPHVTGLLPD
jgi:hypothetical protein